MLSRRRSRAVLLRFDAKNAFCGIASARFDLYSVSARPVTHHMNIRDLLHTSSHRPWPMPFGAWRYYQEWNRALFLHWQVDEDKLRAMVPPTLEIDLFEGKPWVSVVAFTMERIRPRFLPAFPPISNFDEINIRTYVKQGAKSGVYFLSIEAGNPISCAIARSLSGLPYRYSTIKREREEFRSANVASGDQLQVAYTVGEPLTMRSSLDTWLTERYALFLETKDILYSYDIHHKVWPLNTLFLRDVTCAYPRFEPLFSGFPHRVHYSPGVEVIAWNRQYAG